MTFLIFLAILVHLTLDTGLALVGVLVGLVGIVLGVIAIKIGLRHLKEIKLVLNRSQTQLKKLEGFKGSISTHYLAEFPEFMSEIISLLRTARSTVLIFCDIPAYGQLSAHADWIQYSRAIEDLKEDVDLELICLDHKRRVSFYSEFLQGTPWVDWKKDPTNQERLEHLFAGKQGKLNIHNLSEQAFVNLLEDGNKMMLKQAFSKILPKEIKSFMPAYFWLIDGRHAIFSIPVLHRGHTEYGFSTTDQKLIEALSDMKERYLRMPAAHPHASTVDANDRHGSGS